VLPTASGAGVLATDTDTPPMTQSPVRPDLLHALNVITKLGVKVLCEHLGVFARLEILLPVEEPQRDLELARVLNDGHELLNLIGSHLSRALVHINLRLLAYEVSKTASDSLDLGQAEDNITLPLNIGVQDTKNMLELLRLHHGAPVKSNSERVRQRRQDTTLGCTAKWPQQRQKTERTLLHFRLVTTILHRDDTKRARFV